MTELQKLEEQLNLLKIQQLVVQKAYDDSDSEPDKITGLRNFKQEYGMHLFRANLDVKFAEQAIKDYKNANK